jgi:hypothetical protein
MYAREEECPTIGPVFFYRCVVLFVLVAAAVAAAFYYNTQDYSTSYSILHVSCWKGGTMRLFTAVVVRFSTFSVVNDGFQLRKRAEKCAGTLSNNESFFRLTCRAQG